MEINLISLILGGILWELIKGYINSVKEKRQRKREQKIQQ